jgi:hypothetical protein
VIEEGDAGVSHGMCEACVPKVLAEVEDAARRRAEERRAASRPAAEPEGEGQSA